MFPSINRRIAWVLACFMTVAAGWMHFIFALHFESLTAMIVVMLSDMVIVIGSIYRREWAWHLAMLSALHVAIREPLYPVGFVYPFATPYLIGGILIVAMWICRHEFGVGGLRWTKMVVSVILASVLLLTFGYYFPRVEIDYAYPVPWFVQLIHKNDFGPTGLQLYLYACGLLVYGSAFAVKWMWANMTKPRTDD